MDDVTKINIQRKSNNNRVSINQDNRSETNESVDDGDEDHVPTKRLLKY